MMGLYAFALLVAALALFLLSTKQWRLWKRALIWAVGVGLLAVAVWVGYSNAPPGMSAALQALREPGATNFVVSAYLRNGAGFLEFSWPLIGAFAVLTMALAALALLAFTPGERLERGIRPAKLLLAGAIVGCAMAFFVVAVGFGGGIERRAYFDYIENVEDVVYDGDTIQIGETSLRLFGLDAPELEQPCFDENENEQACGEFARKKLVGLLGRSLIYCTVIERERDGEASIVETFGRPLATCLSLKDGESYDVAEFMISTGLAVAYREYKQGRSAGEFKCPGGEDAQRYCGLDSVDAAHIEYCWLQPSIWRARSGRAIREQFMASRGRPDAEANNPAIDAGPDLDSPFVGCRA